MKQNINLYDARFLKRRDWLSGRSVGLMLLLAFLAVVLGTIYARWALAEEEAHAQAVASQLLEARTSFADLTRSLTARKPDDKLAEQVELLQRELDLARQTKTLLANMSDHGGSLMVGEMMRVLTRVGADGLWLTGLAVSAGGKDLEIRGRMLDQSMLPGYLRRLEREPVFKGRSFAALELRGKQWLPPEEEKAAAKRSKPSDAKADSKQDRWYVEFALHTVEPVAEDDKGKDAKAAMPAGMKLDDQTSELVRKGMGL